LTYFVEKLDENSGIFAALLTGGDGASGTIPALDRCC
jgi:hypothetical protein